MKDLILNQLHFTDLSYLLSAHDAQLCDSKSEIGSSLFNADDDTVPIAQQIKYW